ncbi:MAG: tRNA uridine-5-carboxymethylaminomethyl(34) synthesis GTPase MnmE [candidate division WOR-3 bacterium]|nr:tRNA uridine-5-carboxymethylaminomethyl(34) synthesis GTPase MnmE [candidate division WOR-3 bacterium]MCX7756978.1 tRNA uridine-5-carboxymethylaminomethyl(34) synthesis GTPase MnmE [candidate division WOR-3 bacterium]MDW7987937.1 tRNA uridine-5-carboxymethylaminomethyl(34) synthesis GTPase MnmE [candidate division WOR-3 bacterium]
MSPSYDTITAIATASGVSAINVIRISGPDAIRIADQIFRGQKSLREVPSHTIHYGTIIDPDTNEVLDEVLVSIFRAPHSYTGEDMVEISCHGGNYVAPKILQVLTKIGARLSEPGEFTRRRFLNGKIDLTQAEAVLALTTAQNELAYRSALALLQGSFTKYIEELRTKIKNALVELENLLEFEENSTEAFARFYELKKHLKEVRHELKTQIDQNQQLSFLSCGVYCAIVGKANVGKSSLFNRLLGEDKAIVTSIPGTTRDSIEQSTVLGGIVFHFIDTCGIKILRHIEGQKKIEALGIRRTQDWISKADILIAVFDNSKPLTRADELVINSLKEKPTLWVINKIDRPKKLDYNKLPAKKLYLVSAKYNQGISMLKAALVKNFERKLKGLKSDFLLNERHILILQNVIDLLSKALAENYFETVIFNLRNALDELGKITRPVSTEEVLDEIFKRFCIGK